MKRILSLFLVAAFCLCLFGGCSLNEKRLERFSDEKAPSAEAVDYYKAPVAGDYIEPTDYSQKDHWVTIGSAEKDVDVFVLYPTTFSPADKNQQFAAIDDETMSTGAKTFVENYASCMEKAGNIYAPLYRQLNANWLLTKEVKEQTKYLEGVPKTDVIAAFEYFLNNYNEGRPFIIFSHSQGSTMNKIILFDYLKDHPEVAKRLVASYVIGYSVTEDELAANEHVKFASGPDDTGVIISYNTEAPNTKERSTVWLEGSVAINPLSWSTKAGVAEVDKNLGSRVAINGEYRKVDRLANAAVDPELGVVICSSVDIEEYSAPKEMEVLFPKGCYHQYDVSFYYYNLEANAVQRAEKYLKDNPGSRGKTEPSAAKPSASPTAEEPAA